MDRNMFSQSRFVVLWRRFDFIDALGASTTRWPVDSGH
jgi:hypothetical protein